MSTFLSKLFKPKWQSKNKATRLESLETLSDSNDDEKNILIELIKSDPDADVRIAAVQKLNDTQALANLHNTSIDATRSAIESRLQTLATSQSLSIFDLVLDPNLLAEMITSANNPEPFINGLARIQDSSTLLSIALKGKTSKIRQAAAELVSTESDLKTLTQEVKSKDKGVYQIAKAQLDRIRSEAKHLADTQALVTKTLASIQEHATTENTKQYDSKLESLIQRWNGLVSSTTESEQDQFSSALTQCRERMQQAEQEALAKTQAELMEKAGGDEQEATVLTLEQTIAHFREQPASTQEVSSLDALIKTQETRWLEATKQSQVDKSRAKHYQVLMTTLRSYLKALQKLAEKHEALTQAIEQVSTQHQASNMKGEASKANSALQKLINDIDWPSDFPSQTILADANQALGKSKDLNAQFAQNAEQALEQIQDKISLLDKQLEDRQVKASNKTLKQIQGLISNLNAKQGEKVHNQLTLRIKQLNELRDWQGYASTPRQLELCEQMERLSEQTLPPQDKADKIKAMQSEWKSLGGARDESLWDRFKSASDKAYEPCKAYFAEQSALKDNNLAKRQTLIEQLQDFVEHKDWSNPDWKAADKISKQAKHEWRDAYPVDHKANRPLQKQFNDVLAKLDGYLSEERGRNLELKQAIVNKAQALSGGDDLPAAMNEAKQLQKEWQSVGITEHKQDRALWKQFREACDAIFQRRDQEREQQKADKAASIDAANDLIARYKATFEQLNDLSIDQTKALLDELRQENKGLPPLSGKALSHHHDAFEALVKLAKQHIKTLKNVDILEGWKEISRRATLVRQFHTGEISSVDDIESRFSYHSAGLPSELATPFKELWIATKAKSVKTSQIIDLDQARAQCIQCEIAAGIESPEAEKELRMQLQVTRLSEGMSASVSQSREDQLTELLKNWYLSVGLSQEDYQPLESRIEQCIEQLFKV